MDAESGEVLLRRQTTFFISDASYRVYTSDSPSPFTPGWPTPNAAQPPYTNRVLVTLSALDVIASPNGWINDGDNETRGNNADCFLDRDFDFQPDGPRPQGNPFRVFDFPLDLTQDPITYTNASIVQMFYWVNWFHDRMYRLGFTESAGNFQEDNFGRGGLGGDSIIGYVQSGADAGLFNNAFFIPAPDGINGQIAMFLWNFPTPDRDGDLDAEVILHEATHGLTTRLVGGGSGMTASQTRGLGEGWSDFYALALLSEAGDDVDGVYPMGGYVTYQLAGLQQNYYFGIRRYPYSTDMTKNPLTFKDIDPTQISPHPGVPRSPIWPFDPDEADEEHNQGEVWCAILWEVRANLIRKYGYPGNELMLQLVTDGLKLCPPNPNFIEARDAIILADLVATGGANARELWTGFAKRGLGFSAQSPASTTTIGVVEAYDTPGLRVVGALVVGGNGNGLVDVNECNDLYLIVANFNNFTATRVRARVHTTTRGVGLGGRESAYRDLPSLALGTNLVPFRLSTAPYMVCGTPVVLDVVLESDQETVTNTVTLPTGVMGPVRRYNNNAPVPIPDNNPNGANSAIVVSNLTTAVRKVAVSVYITHTWVGDLRLELVAPDGTTVVLSDSNGGRGDNYGTACSPDSCRTTFDDDGPLPMTTGIPPYQGTFRPQQPLTAFVGKSGDAVNGVWRLRVVDQEALDTGAIECWSLFLWPAECTDGGGSCPGADLAVSMTAAPEPVFVGSNLVYTITVTNRGPSAARSATVRHELPEGVVFVHAAPGRGTATPAGNTVVWNLGDLPYGAQSMLWVTVQPTTAGVLTSRAVVFSLDPDGDLSNNEATVVSRAMPRAADLDLSVEILQEQALQGQPLTYRVRVSNRGVAPATGMGVTNELPQNLQVVSVSSSKGRWQWEPWGLVWTLESLAAGEAAELFVTGIPTAAGVLVWRGMVDMVQVDPFRQNNVVELSTPVVAVADLSLLAVARPNPAVLNEPFEYFLRVRNAGPAMASGVTLRGTFSPGQTILSSSASQGSVTIQGENLSASFGDLLPGQEATLNVRVTASTAGTFALNVSASAHQLDVRDADNTAALRVIVAPPFFAIGAAGVSLLAESVQPPNGAVDVDETVTVELRLWNTGNIPNVDLVATLLPGNGVENPSGPQVYGVLMPGAAPVGRQFTFTARPTSEGVVRAILELTDNGQPLPAVEYTFVLPRVVTFTNTTPIQILDNRPASPYPSVIQVSGVTGTVGRVTVTLSNLTHAYAPDVRMLLVGPRGQKTVLMSAAGAPYGVSQATLTFDDAAETVLPEWDALVSGQYRPATYGTQLRFPAPAPDVPYGTTLSQFAGVDPNGTWSLYVWDNASGDVGFIAGGWSLNLHLISPVNELADVRVLADPPSRVLVGQPAVMTYTVTNLGPDTARGVVMRNQWPGEFRVLGVETSADSWSLEGQTVLAIFNELAAGDAKSLRVTFDVNEAGQFGVIAQAVGSGVDLNLSDNALTNVLNVALPLADLQLSPDPTNAALVLGQEVDLVLSLRNAGPEPALNSVVRIPLPAALELVASSVPGGVLERTSEGVEIRYDRLVEGLAVHAVLRVRARDAGAYQLEAVASTDSAEATPSDNRATVVLNIAPPQPRLIVTGVRVVAESQAPPNGALDQGEEVTLALGLRNVGELPTQNLVVSLLERGGVSSPGAAQTYGVLEPGGGTIWRQFTFTVNRAAGEAVEATWELRDGATLLGTVTQALRVARTYTFRSEDAIRVPERGPANPYPSLLTVSGLSGSVLWVRVTLHGFTHGYPDDVDVLLVGPAGQKVMLVSDAGGGWAVTNLTLALEDSAGDGLPDNARLSSGAYRPTDFEGFDVLPAPAPPRPYANNLGALVGTDPNGTWSLYAADDVAGERGGITGGWTLELSVGEPVSPPSNLHLTAEASRPSVSAGQEVIYTLTVSNDGPAPAAEVVLHVALPPSSELLEIMPSDVTSRPTPAGLEIFIGELSPGESSEIRLRLRLWESGSAGALMVVESANTDPDGSNNQLRLETAVTTVRPARLQGGFEDGLFRITLEGQPDETYVLQVSEDLQTWMDVETRRMPSSGEVKFTDPGSTGHGPRYYRAVRLLSR
ncbi:MAG: M36 family metallopeptidase [Limisphaera sp.]